MPALHCAKTDPAFASALAAARWRRGMAVGGLSLALLALTACGKSEEPPAQAPSGGGRPAPAVGVVTVQPGDVALLTELPGRLEASRTAEVRARAAGILQKRLFREGSDVKAGQALFTIDAAPYTAAMQSAQASLSRAQANLVQAKSLADRYKPLLAANAVSQQEYATAVATYKQAEADVAVGRAALQTSRINLNYANVRAPISGRIGRSLVTEGALVGQGEATPLAVIQQINPMYVNFTQSAGEVLKLRRAMESGQFKKASGEGAASVRVVLEDGSTYEQPGRLLFSELSVDQSTGQITLRAEVPNARGQLLPGLYVRVQLEQAQATNAISLPQQAVTRSAQGDTVMVVGPEGLIETRNITIGSAQNSRWVVLDGLKAGEQVVVDGFQKLQMLPPGAPVKAVPWQPPGAAPAANGSNPPATPAPAEGAAASDAAAAPATAQ